MTLPGRRAHRTAKLACLAALLAVLSGMSPARANDLVVGRMAPSITLDTLDGKHIDTRDLRGKVVIVTFWATWCEPCREELPLLSRYASEHGEQGLVVLGFSLDGGDNLARVRAVADTLSFPVGLLGDPHVPGYGRIWHLPVSFVIDREGRLIDDGWKDAVQTWTSGRLQQVVTPLLDRAG
jgi:cytochrome c biogenesis protein CcmG, thiol:disulfide interchange protein DsbE